MEEAAVRRRHHLGNSSAQLERNGPHLAGTFSLALSDDLGQKLDSGLDLPLIDG